MKWGGICCRTCTPVAVGELTGREWPNRDGEIRPTIG